MLASMASERSAAARFTEVAPVVTDGRVGLVLGFRPTGRIGIDHIEDFADLGPELTVPAVAGVGKVLRILRAARIAGPSDPHALVGQPEQASDLLQRALGTAVRIAFRERSRLRFTAWTDDGVEEVRDVVDVREAEEAYIVYRRGARFPLRFDREAVVRHQTELERWFEVVDIERS
jgi:hypothetical protein